MKEKKLVKILLKKIIYVVLMKINCLLKPEYLANIPMKNTFLMAT